jgi:hypothetical protein
MLIQSHARPCLKSKAWQGWRGGKDQDVETGKIHIIVVRQKFGISVDHLYKWALKLVERRVRNKCSTRSTVPMSSMLDACVCVSAFRCVRNCAVRCPPVAVSGHAFRCVLAARCVLATVIRRKFNWGISNADSR